MVQKLDEIIILGTLYTVECFVKRKDTFDISQFIKLSRDPSKNKILRISKPDNLDLFTSQYGKVDDNTLYINWIKLSKFYKGIYFKASAFNGRETDIPYKDKTMKSWINHDMYPDFIGKVVIFVHRDTEIIGEKITKPFKGSVVSELEFDEEDFIDVKEKSDLSKIVIIDDIKSFDVFTRRYGFVKDKFIDLKWDEIKKDYKGFYIENSKIIQGNRYKVAFLSDKRYGSWLVNNNIKLSAIYLFEQINK